MPFPILRTSFVVLSEIISLLKPNEIVTASFCSNKVKRLLKRHYQQRKPSEWKLFMIDYDSWGQVDIKTSKDGKQIIVISAKHISEIQGHKLKHDNIYQRAFSYGCPVLYFNDQVLGTKMIVDYITDLFGLDISGVVVDRYGIWAIDWINEWQEKKLDSLNWKKNPKYNSNTDEKLDYVLRNTRVSLCCNIDDNVSDNFTFNGKLAPMRQLFIRSNGHWVTCNNLMNIDCRYIRIEGSRLSVSDVNSFLRHWRTGGSARLEWLQVRFEKHAFRERFDEDLEVVKTNEERVYRRSCDGLKRVFHGGYSIQRMDGVKAMIQCPLGLFIMAVWHERAIDSMIQL